MRKATNEQRDTVMARKLIRVSKKMVFTWAMLAGLIILFAPQSMTNKFQFAFSRIFHWPLSIGRNFTLLARTQDSPSDVVPRFEYAKLENHLSNLTKLLEQEHQKVERLSGLRSKFGLVGAKLVCADVITAILEGPRNELMLNRGQNDGLAKGQYVLGINNIIGVISEVTPKQAKVKLVTDRTSSMESEVTGLKTVLKGNGGNCAKVPLMSLEHKIKAGDIVYACKKPGLLEVPIMIGKVTMCKRDTQKPQLLDITVEPSCDVAGLTSVDVITMNP
jgi:rod shape-determining protein MreC